MTKNSNIKSELAQIEKAKQNKAAFGPLYEKYFNQIFRFVFYRVESEHLADDITSQVFIKAMINIKKYQHKGHPFSAWLYRIATNEVYTYFRSQKKNQEVELTEDNVGYIIEEANLDIKTIQLDAVIASLNNLKEEHTQLIEFRFFEKLSFKEIGQIYGITEANAKTKVYRVLDRIKKLITLTDKK